MILGILILVVLIGFILFIIQSEKIEVKSSLAEKIAHKKKLNMDDFKKSQDYYRDIICQYSPTLLSYIDDFSLDLPRDIVVIIMILEKKGYLKVKDGIFINETKNKEDNNLTEIEKYVLKNIENGNLNFNDKDIEKIVQKEGIEKQLLTKNVKNETSKFMHIDLLLFILLMIPSMLEKIFKISMGFLPLICSILIIALIVICIVHFSYGLEVSKNPFYRTRKGNEINKKIEGLKLFLKDYGNMKNKEAEMIKLWEDYLIYAIIFHQNDIAISKYLKYCFKK